MRRLIAAVLRYLFPDRKVSRSAAEQRWQALASSGRHATAYARYTPPPPPRRSPEIPVYLPRATWLQIAAHLTWMGTSSPALRELRIAINSAVSMTRPPAGPATQWDLDTIEFGRYPDG